MLPDQPSLDSFSTPTAHARVGIVDIGSNSLRLVVYDELKRAPVPLYNEKVLCQLGKGVATSGKLNPEGVEQAKASMHRLMAMAETLKVTKLHAIATAAVREASDGKTFVKELEQAHNIMIDIISGEHEARLGAYGMMASTYKPDGITGDLGGGSMELVRLESGEINEQVTLPVGPLRLLDETGGDSDDIHRAIARAFSNEPWLHTANVPNFYAIGGSFRAIARQHMLANDYPLRIVHHYTVPAKEMAEFARKLAAMSPSKLEKLSGLPSKRVATVVPAAIILEQIIQMIRPDQVIFSGSGIREGLLHERLDDETRKQDALIAACWDIVGHKQARSNYASELMTWMQPLMGTAESESEHRLRLAFCLLSDLSHHLHPEYRAEWGMMRVLYSSLTSLTHSERTQLALALYHRYQYKLKDNFPVLKLANERQMLWARMIGTATNLAYHLTGGMEGKLHETLLKTEGKEISLSFSDESAVLQGDAISKRINGVQESYRKWRSMKD